jgi:COP9 signalosome complex subunit 1
MLAIIDSALEKELAELVAADQVQARIDSHAKVLYARLTDTRAATFERALKMGESHFPLNSACVRESPCTL